MKVHKFLAATALISAAYTGVAGASPPASNYHQQPSCSLHPNQLGDGTYSFTNTNPNGDWPIPLTVWNYDNSDIAWQGFLRTGDSTPVLNLSLESGIGWSNNHENDEWTDPGNATYSLGDYEQDNWCEPTVPSTTVPNEPTTTQPPTSTTVPVATTTTEPTLPVEASSTSVVREQVCIPDVQSNGTHGVWDVTGPNGNAGQYCSLGSLVSLPNTGLSGVVPTAMAGLGILLLGLAMKPWRRVSR